MLIHIKILKCALFLPLTVLPATALRADYSPQCTALRADYSPQCTARKSGMPLHIIYDHK